MYQHEPFWCVLAARVTLAQADKKERKFLGLLGVFRVERDARRPKEKDRCRLLLKGQSGDAETEL
jgi:hypothetical protein